MAAGVGLAEAVCCADARLAVAPSALQQLFCIFASGVLTCACLLCDVPHAEPSQKPRNGSRRRGRQRQEGLQVAGGVRLLSYCARHGAVAAGKSAAPSQPLAAQQAQQELSMSAALAAAGCLVPAVGEQQLSRQASLAAATSAAVSGGARQQQSAAAAAGEPPQGPRITHPYGSARAIPFNHAARRGQRAPEAVAAAEAKRLFVRSRPYLVGGPLQQPADWVPHSSCQRLGPDGPRGKLEDAEEEEEGGAEAGAEAAAPEGQQPQPAAAEAAPASPPTQPSQRLQRAGAKGQQERQQAASPAAGQARLLASPRAALKSDTDRYHEMVATLGHRVRAVVPVHDASIRVLCFSESASSLAAACCASHSAPTRRAAPAGHHRQERHPWLGRFCQDAARPA